MYSTAHNVMQLFAKYMYAGVIGTYDCTKASIFD
jgi:hypothetical protein